MTDVAANRRAETDVPEIVISGPDDAFRRWADRGPVPDEVRIADPGEVGERAFSPVTELGHILWLGWPGQETADTPEAAERLWVLVDDVDVDWLRQRSGAEIKELVGRLTRARGVVVADESALSYLTRRVPAQAATFYSARSGASLTEVLELLHVLRATEDGPKVLLHRPRGAKVRDQRPSSTPGTIHELCENPEDLRGSLADARHLLGAPDEHRAGRRIKPRNAAWHLSAAAGMLGGSVLLTDDLDVAVVLTGYKHLDIRVWLLIDLRQTVQLRDPQSPGHGDLVRALQAVLGKGGQIAVCDPDIREELRDVPDVGSRILVLGEGGELDLEQTSHLARTLGWTQPAPRATKVLLAGHDFKFAGELVQVLEQTRGVDIVFDRWERQNRQSVSQSDRLLREADVILCEFASHNAVWYSWHKLPGQRLVVRFHGYELFQDWITEINLTNVDMFVFVSDFYREKVVRELGWPREKTVMVPNMIDVDDLDRPKADFARFHLGIVGIVPILKRPDRALDLLERLVAEDDRYVLHVRGRNPWDYQWMWREPVVRDAYEAFYERLAQSPRLLQHVAFDGFGPDMGRWFRRIGWTLSPSYRETFHLAPVEGMPGGAVPVVWQREGATEIFGEPWVHGSTDEAARFILSVNVTAERYRVESTRVREFAHRYSIREIAPAWLDTVFGPGQQNTGLDERFDRADLERRYVETPTPAALDRLLLLILKQDRDLDAARALMAEFPKQALSASRETRELLDDLTVENAFSQAVARRPPRSEGAVYQVRPGTALTVDLAQHFEGEDDALSLGISMHGGTGAEQVCSITEGTEPAHLVQIAADAIMRAARLHRPQALVTVSAWECSWPTVIAARRLGIPTVLSQGGSDDGQGPDHTEFDAVLESLDDLTAETVEVAAATYRRLTHREGAPQLRDLTVGIIADEFTRRTVSGRCRTVTIHRKDAYLQVASTPLDVLFIESAWGGPDNEWFHGVAYYKDERADIEQVVKVARARNIPVVFWNKEDPVHFRSFAPTATLCDAVFTTDADRIPAYLDHGKSGEGDRPWVAASLPFYAEPRLHNPLPGEWPERRTISYAGTYYGQRYPERSDELDRILSKAAAHGLTIYDRQLNHANSPYHFPDHYAPFIEGGLSYDEVLEAYKAHPVHINVNSVNDSPTMFSRRVVEIAASGAVVVSGRGQGLNETLPAVPASDDVDVLDEVMGACLADREVWARQAWLQLRAVRRTHLADQALAIMFRSVGIPVRLEPDSLWVARVEQLEDDVVASLLVQTVRPAAVEVTASADPRAAARLEAAGITTTVPAEEHWTIDWSTELPQEWAEDLLYAVRFCPEQVTTIGARRYRGEHGILSWDTVPEGPVFRRSTGACDEGRSLVWLLPAKFVPDPTEQAT